jgi:hypothetical protein
LLLAGFLPEISVIDDARFGLFRRKSRNPPIRQPGFADYPALTLAEIADQSRVAANCGTGKQDLEQTQ